MNTNTDIPKTIAILVAGFAMAFIFYIQSNKFIHNAAIDGCYQAGRTAFTNPQSQQITTPENYWYTLCMSEKGYSGK